MSRERWNCLFGGVGCERARESERDARRAVRYNYTTLTRREGGGEGGDAAAVS